MPPATSDEPSVAALIGPGGPVGGGRGVAAAAAAAAAAGAAAAAAGAAAGVPGGGATAAGGGAGESADSIQSRSSAQVRPGTAESRKRSSFIAGLDCSPPSGVSSELDGADLAQQQEDERRHPVKRACNECRQQKLRCDVVQDPFTVCSRCRRLNLSCRIQDNFKRVGKRSRNAEMEKEIGELRKQLAHQTSPVKATTSAKEKKSRPAHYASVDQYGSNEAVEGLMGLSGGLNSLKRIEDVLLTQDCVSEVFNIFFSIDHLFVPLLDSKMSPEAYFELYPPLFWAIVGVGARRYQTDTTLLHRLSGPVTRLIWSALADLKHMYGVVKALCLLCTWPFPTSSTSSDPTFMLSGVMMQLAMQIGLHRPRHAQDFSKFRMELQEDELRDRVRTWATVTVVSQRVATGYGQPSNTLYDWTLGSPAAQSDHNFALPATTREHLRIERFIERVSNSLYSNYRDPVGLVSDAERQRYVSLLATDFDDLEAEVQGEGCPVTPIYLRAANLHLWLSAFFSPPSLPSYRSDLLRLYQATTSFLETCLGLDQASGPTFSVTGSNRPDCLPLRHGTNYIFQMLLAAGFALMKLHGGFIQQMGLDAENTEVLLTNTIWALRRMSVQENDLAQRLAEVLAQLWKGTRADAGRQGGARPPAQIDNSMQLKVRCRMSMSLVFDSVWRWREEAQRRGISLESYLKHPTDPSAITDSSASSVIASGNNNHGSSSNNNNNEVTSEPPLRPPSAVPGMPGMATGIGLPGNGALTPSYMEANYEVFDPLNWMLDGLVDFPYSLTGVQDLEPASLGGLGGMS